MIQNIPKKNNFQAHELRALFEKQLKELYWAEETMISILKNCIADVSSKDLTEVIKTHRIETNNHLIRLENIFMAIGITPEIKIYKALQCLFDEANSINNLIPQGVVRDAAIIAILQKIKHYEIACYGTMRAYAIALREEDIILLLEETLKEEKDTDLALSYIAESHINIEAADKEI